MMTERPTYADLGYGCIQFTVPANWTYTTTAVSHQKYDQIVFVHDTLYSDEETFLHNSQGINEVMDNAVDGIESSSMDVQRVPVTVTVEFFHSTVVGQDICNLVTDKNRSDKVQIVKIDKPCNAPKGTRDYMTLYVFVLDSVANSVENTPFNDMILVVNMTYTPLTSNEILNEPENLNLDPPPPPPDTKPGYNPYLDIKRPCTLPNYLRYYDTVFLIDDSSSMSEDHPSKWQQCIDAVTTIFDAAIDYAADGIHIYFLNSDLTSNMKDPRNIISDKSKVREILESVYPSGGTPTGEKLRDRLEEHLGKIKDVAGKSNLYKEIKPLDLIVITDGSPNNNDLCKSVLEDAARYISDNKFHPNHIGVQFVQIGNDPGAKGRLAELAQANVNGMVDTVPFRATLTGDDLKRILLGGMHPNLRI